MDNNLFYEAMEKAEESISMLFALLRAENVDMVESNVARRLRSIQSGLGNVRDEIEELGLLS